MWERYFDATLLFPFLYLPQFSARVWNGWAPTLDTYVVIQTAACLIVSSLSPRGKVATTTTMAFISPFHWMHRHQSFYKAVSQAAKVLSLDRVWSWLLGIA